jgi:H+-transporting ATPase
MVVMDAQGSGGGSARVPAGGDRISASTAGIAFDGLRSGEAERRLREYGPNAVKEESPRSWLVFLGKLWAPVPWMLEAAIGLELLLGRRGEAIAVTALLLFNALVSFAQEHRAQRALVLLRQRLTVQARVRRDGRWLRLGAQALVPGDVIHLRVGDLVPADARLADGQLLVDQSPLTGESLPKDLAPGDTAYAGAVVKRGESTAEVVATGARTYFGKTAELVRTAQSPSHLEVLIFRIVKRLVALDLLLVVAVVTYALLTAAPLAEVLPFALMLLVASVPVALPATFALATALGAQGLAGRKVLVTRLAAIEDAAAMDVLCSDKTGTLTQNHLAVADVKAYAPHTPDDVLRWATLACDEATQDPIDLAILAAAQERHVLSALPERIQFMPFDPATKRSEAVLREAGRLVHALKGAPPMIASLVAIPGAEMARDVEVLAAQGFRVLAVAGGPPETPALMGLVSLQDPPRPDSRAIVRSLQDLGVRVVMVTGDGLATARVVAAQVGIGDRACAANALRTGIDSRALASDIFAGVFPDDKFRLVQALQEQGHVVGMTGDGVNDSPALKQAEVGIAVSSATDVAKASASLILTSPGLGDIVAAVETARRIYQRMLTYTLNKIIKTVEVSLFLTLGLILTGAFITTPRLIVLLLIANDFVTMSIATDRVSFARAPDRWQVPHLVTSAVALALPLLGVSFTGLWIGRSYATLDVAQLQTLVFVILVFSGQATVYLVRERRHFWSSRPSWWMIASSLGDIAIVSTLATRGWLMAPIPIWLVATLLGLSLTYLIGADVVKIRVFARSHLR